MQIKGPLYRQEGSFGIYQMAFPFLFTDGEMKEYLGTTYGESWGFVKNNFGQVYLQEDKMEGVVKSFLKIAKDGFPKEWEERWAELDTKVTDKSYEISTAQLHTFSPEELYKLYRELELLHEQMWAISIFIDTFDTGTDQREIEKISKQHGFTPEETQALLSPTKPSYIAEWDDYLYQYKNGEVTFTKMREKFFWRRTDYIHFGELDEAFIKNAAENAHPSHFTSPSGEQKKILEKYNLLENPLQTFQTLSLWRDERKRLNFTGLHGLESVLSVVFKKQNVPFAFLNGLIPEEAKAIILGEKIDKEKLRERIEDGFFAHFKSQKVKDVKHGREAVEEGKRLENLFVGDVQKDLKGTVACKGYARGTARVVLNAHGKAAETMRDGDILVTSMTRPEFINLMKKAAAFVTDEGGISCHAAIVAREMNKPCIIGTRTATKVIHDGDLVEVDANSGVVRILDKNNA